MSSHVQQNNHPISQDTRSLISKRYKTITKAVNSSFWDSSSETAHSRYVGSYGRGTAINTSDLDVLIELPDEEYDHFTSLTGNGPSRLLQAVKDAILEAYPKTDVKGDGQVVVVKFSDGMKFEILPAFQHASIFTGLWDGTYLYPDTHMGGNWMTTNPKAEQDAMADRNGYYASNGLLFDTCKHIRYVRSDSFSSYHLSGILIDSFVYAAIKDWHWLRDGEQGSGKPSGTYEQVLLDYYNQFKYPTIIPPTIKAPGSGMQVGVDDWDVLGKVLNKMV